MKHVMQRKEPHVTRRMRVPASAIAVAAVAAAAGIAAGHGSAASAANAGKPPYPSHAAKFKQPKLKAGTLAIKGTNAGERIALRLAMGDPGVLQVDVGDDGSADFSFARADVAKIALDARGGNDAVRIDESNGVFTDSIPTTIDGGNGNDNLAGGSGAETLRGGRGNDTIDGNKGSDIALMGAGDDTFIWDPGDGSDSIEGGAGADTMRFNGAGVAERVDLSANGSHLRFFRDVATITMDTHGVERVDFNALGGPDLVTVNDLSGTDVTSVNVDLAGALGGAAGDGQADRVVVNGTNGNDSISVNGDAGGVKASGLAATVEVLHSEAANDRLEINTQAGMDSVDSGGLAAGAIQLLVDGVLVP
jgi:Ca2+-binding RTX toxin-like protein